MLCGFYLTLGVHAIHKTIIARSGWDHLDVFSPYFRGMGFILTRFCTSDVIDSSYEGESLPGRQPVTAITSWLLLSRVPKSSKGTVEMTVSVGDRSVRSSVEVDKVDPVLTPSLGGVFPPSLKLILRRDQ